MGKGYGSALLECALDELGRLGFRQVLLWVLEDNMRARAFYEKCGFTPTEEYMTESFAGRELREQLYILRD